MKIDTKKFKQALEKEQKTLESELKTIGRKNPSNPNDWEALPDKLNTDNADDVEIAESITSYEDNTASLKELEIRFNEIKSALERIDNGTFGLCKKCGKEIEKGRLDANPAANTCITHMEE
jgi:RNA polymerase-binding transcription factor DksA